MQEYLNALQTVLDKGVPSDDRTGTGTTSYFGMQCRYDLRDGFPLVTTKKLHLKSIIHELLWFLAGDTNITYLKDNGVRIGMNGRTRTVTSGRSTGTSGGTSHR